MINPFAIRCAFFSLAGIAALIILFLSIFQIKKKEQESIEDTTFLFYLLVRKILEQLEEIKEDLGKDEYNELKELIEKMKTDLFGK